MPPSSILLAAGLGLAGLAGPARALAPQSQDLQQRPDPSGTPTEVSIGVYVIDVTDIQHVSQTMEVDFVLHVGWRDPRLASEDGRGRVLDTTEAWFPNPIIANERRLLSKRLPEVLRADGQGSVRYVQRFVGQLSAPVDLRDFPLDQQSFAIRIVLPWTDEEVRITPNPERTGRAPELSVPGWSLGPGAVHPGLYHYPADGRELPSLDYAIPGRRLLPYYAWKVLLPLLLIVSMSWAAFWMGRDQFGPRLSVGTTSVLTLIAYWFVLGSLLPRLPYLTRLDLFLIGSTLLVFLALVETVTSGYLVRAGRENAAQALDNCARAAFPVAYLLVLFSTLWL